MKLSFYGAAGEVTGSNFLIETNSGVKILVDCGMFQGNRFAEDKNYRALPYQPSNLNAVILTHAHLDHCGRLPLLTKNGYQNKIYTTLPTIELTQIILEDAAKIISEEAEEKQHRPLYENGDVVGLMPHFLPLAYHEKKEIAPGVFATFFDAGHILGSAFVLIDADDKKILFSGDLGNPPASIIRDTEDRPYADFILVDSTYGGRVHETMEERGSKIKNLITKITEQKGVLLIPAFTIERTQEIIYELNEYFNRGELARVPIFIDSPMAVKATEVFRRNKRFWDSQAVEEGKVDGDIFSFPGVEYILTADQSKAINNIAPPKVIIAGSGMMNGGRILHHLKRYVSDQNSTLFIVGYQVEGTLGRRIQDGEKTIKIMGETMNVGIKVEVASAYSGHADQPKILRWLSSHPKSPQKIFSVHGDPDQLSALAQVIPLHLSSTVKIPKYGESVEI